VSLGAPLLACLQHTAACVSLLSNHNVKERRSTKSPILADIFLSPQTLAEAGACGPRRLGPGGKARFLFAPLSDVNDLFAQKTHFFRLIKNPMKSARFCTPERLRCLRKMFGSRNDL
jgi:hypothetical protein